jgi:hypothetical protein
MRVTIVPEDHLIIRDTTIVNLPDWPFEDGHIHAIQFLDGAGERELKGPPPRNEPFEGTTPLQPYLAALDAYLASLPPEPELLEDVAEQAS